MMVAGLAHFAAPRTYERIVPRLVGDAEHWVRWTGVAEIALAALIVPRRTRRAAAWATALLLVVVFPANVKMALDGGLPDASFPLSSPAFAWARLPMQIPLVWWALRVARAARAAAQPLTTAGERR